MKRTAKGCGNPATRWVAKQLLNCLYGIFGRKKDMHTVLTANSNDLPLIMLTQDVKSIIEIGEDLSAVVVNKTATNLKNLQQLNATLGVDQSARGSKLLEGLNKGNTQVKSNVAIAAAVTAYARVFMMPFKLDPSCAYSDTDSIFTKDELGLVDNLIGSELGYFKDELDGQEITQAIFLGIKQYGYTYQGGDKSTFSGVQKNSLTFNEVQRVAQGDMIMKVTGPRFYKSFNTLNIRIKQNTNITIKDNNNKILRGNKYLPINLKPLPLRGYHGVTQSTAAPAPIKGKHTTP